MGEGGSHTRTDQQGKAETLIPEYEAFLELSKREYEGFDEHRTLWAQRIRRLKTGQCLVKLPNDPEIYPVNVERHTPSDLAFDVETLLKRCPQAIDRVYRFIEKNYEDKEFFVTPQEIERETHDRLQRVLHPVIDVASDEPLMIEHRELAGVSLQQELVEENPLA